MKHDANDIDDDVFNEIVLSIFNSHAPLKNKPL